jgi:hypothetical protein
MTDLSPLNMNSGFIISQVPGYSKFEIKPKTVILSPSTAKREISFNGAIPDIDIRNINILSKKPKSD